MTHGTSPPGPGSLAGGDSAHGLGRQLARAGRRGARPTERGRDAPPQCHTVAVTARTAACGGSPGAHMLGWDTRWLTFATFRNVLPRALKMKGALRQLCRKSPCRPRGRRRACWWLLSHTQHTLPKSPPALDPGNNSQTEKQQKALFPTLVTLGLFGDGVCPPSPGRAGLLGTGSRFPYRETCGVGGVPH